MARQTQRKVTRAANKQTIVGHYGKQAWYELPDWAIVWFSANMAWVVLAWAIFISPAALLATVLGAHSLPLQFLGIPATDNGVGLAAVVLIINFVLLVLAIRPLRHKKRTGWMLVITAAVVHLIHSIILQHAISATLILLATIYLYWQLRREFS